MPRTRKTGEGGLYYDKNRDLWIASVDIGFDKDGKRKQKRVSSRSQTIARKKLDALKLEIDNHGSPLGNQTVAEWGVSWLDDFKHKKPQTYRTYASLLKTWVNPIIGRKNLKEVRPSDLKRIYDSMRAAGKSTSTSRKVHQMLSGLFESARKDRLVSYNVVKDVTPPSAAKSARNAFTREQTAAIIHASSMFRDGTKWAVSLKAGIRQGERLGATVDAVDLRTGLFMVKWSLVEGNYDHGCGGTCSAKAAGHCPQKYLLVPDGMDYRVLKGRLMLVPPKSGEARTFPLTVELYAHLEKHLAQMGDRPNPFGLLWPAEDGSPMTARQDQAEWRALLQVAGIDHPEATTHWARHTAISEMTSSGAADRTIGEIVGHKSPGVTGRYQHTSNLDALEALNRAEGRLQIES